MKLRTLAPALLAACGGAATTQPPASQPVTTPPATQPVSGAPDNPTPPAFRLPAGVRPTAYDLDLTVVPGEDSFAGRERIELAVDAPDTWVVWLHATELDVSAADFDGRPARVVAAPPELVGFVSDRPLSGQVRLQVAWKGPIDKVRSRAVYQVAEGNDWYAYTFFEPVDARRAFPCFDEPGFKVPWRLTLHVKKEHVALANAPVAKETDEPNGMKAVSFVETKPLPAYLVAFIVGPFDLLEGAPAGNHGTPFRIAVPKGRGAEAKYALEVTPKIIALEETYFGIPYPFGKLDVAVVPRFWGTMEHPGLVALGQPLTLIRPEEDSVERRQRYANIATHELAHYWFGDLVTMAWWDDTWLNEAMAQWIDARITDQLEPKWNYLRGTVEHAGWTMSFDGHASARSIKMPVTTRTDIEASFDGAITYAKGSLVLGMFEAYVGKEKFQKTIHDYLSAHMWGNAKASDLYDALRTGLGDDLAASFRGFVEQPGVPLVTAALTCGKNAPTAVTLSQRRFLPLGAPAAAETQWSVPVCVAWGTAKARGGQKCMLLKDKSEKLVIDEIAGCPDWIDANAGGQGYYRVVYEGKLLAALLDKGWKQLTPIERVRAVSDLSAQVSAGAVPAADALALVPRLAQDPNREVFAASAEIMRVVRHDLLPKEILPNAQRFIRKVYGPRARALGWTARRGEPDDDRELRQNLIGTLANGGEDVEFIAEARRRFDKWFTDRKSLDPNLLYTVVFITARHGDKKLWDRLHQAAKDTKDRAERGLLLTAMGAIPDAELAKAGLALMASGEFDLREAQGYWSSLLGSPETREIAYQALKQGYDFIVPRMRHDDASHMFHVPALFCDEAHIADARAFFTERAKKIDGAENALNNALDEATQCVAVQAAQKASIEAFLKKY